MMNKQWKSFFFCLFSVGLFLTSFVGETFAQQPPTLSWRDLLQFDYKTGEIPPSLKELQGRGVRIPGFIVPLEGDQDTVSEFLLVPTLGACVHVPAPPPNQIVHVKLPKGKSFDGDIYNAVWVTGTLQISNFKSELADASYSMTGLDVQPYSVFKN